MAQFKDSFDAMFWLSTGDNRNCDSRIMAAIAEIAKDEMDAERIYNRDVSRDVLESVCDIATSGGLHDANQMMWDDYETLSEAVNSI